MTPSAALTQTAPPSSETPSLAVVVGGTGSIGAALVRALQARGHAVLALSRRTRPALDVRDEASIAAAAQQVAAQAQALGAELRGLWVASGFLHTEAFKPEKSWAQLDAAHMAHAFALNAAGPALVMKHFLPLLPRQGRSVCAVLSATVGSIGDNRLGGWYSYRASKAALNQLLRTAAIELRRRSPQAVCVALHPGAVHSPLSAPFSHGAQTVWAPDEAAARLLAVVDGLTPEQTGGFFSHDGRALPW